MMSNHALYAEHLSYLAHNVNIHAPIFCSRCSAVYYYLFVGFNIFFTKRYAFVPSSPFVRALTKKYLKIKFSKYSQVWSCFEALDARNTMPQSKFNLDISSRIYGFFVPNIFACGWCYYCFFLSACIHLSFPLPYANSKIYWVEMQSTTYRAASSGDGAIFYRLKWYVTAPNPEPPKLLLLWYGLPIG